MKSKFVKFAVLAIALVTFSRVGWAQDDGQATFKAKCAACHGPNGEGKIGPALKDTKVSQDDIILMLGKGVEGKKAPHKKPIAGLNDEQIKAVAHYVKSLK